MPVDINFVRQNLKHWRSTEYAEKDSGSPELSFHPESARCQRQYWIPWERQNDAIVDFIGYTTVREDDVGFKYFSRILPHAHAPQTFRDDRARAFYWAERMVRSEGITRGTTADDEGVTQYFEALMTFEYTARPYRLLTDAEMTARSPGRVRPIESTLLRYVWITWRPAGKFQTIPGFGPLLWDGTAIPISNTQVILLTEADIEITYKQIPLDSIPITAIREAIGKTNVLALGDSAAPFRPWAPQTLVFSGPQVSSPYYMANLELAVDLNYRFKYFPWGANAFYRWDANPPGFYTASRDGSGASAQRLYKNFDYSALFAPEP